MKARHPIELGRAREIVARFERLRIAVVGDVILDRYVWGSVDRISPEAPVPVVRVTRESTMLGGAGNVARNVASLGGAVELVAVVGDDEPSREICQRLADWKIDPSGLVIDAERPTTVKTRVIARAQQVVRYDRESEDPLAPSSARRLLDGLRARCSRVEGAILQDYGKGLFTDDVLAEVMRVLGERDVPVFVDPKTSHWELFAGAALVKPNLREAEQVTGIRVRGEADLERLGRSVLERTRAGAAAVTRGESGMTLFDRDGSTRQVPTLPRLVSDVAGAGDTAIAALTLARLAGASWFEAAVLANAAAGVVVAIPGTATASARELLAELGADE